MSETPEVRDPETGRFTPGHPAIGGFATRLVGNPAYPSYPVEQKAAVLALAELAGNQAEAGRVADIPTTTISGWATGRRAGPERAQIDEAKEILARECLKLASKYADHLGKEATIAGAGARDAAQALGTLVKSAAALRGEERNADNIDRPFTLRDFLVAAAARGEGGA